MRHRDRQNRRRAEAEAARLNPIALTLALWLGAVVAVTGLIRLSEAAANARFAQNQLPQHVGDVVRPGSSLSGASTRG